MRRAIIIWTVVAAIVIGGFAVTVTALNASLYSASGFVGGYLDALEHKDATAALELAGSPGGGSASRALLIPEALGELGDIRLVGESTLPTGVHRVVFTWSSDGQPGRSSFDVRRSGAVLGLFDSWEFATAPFAVVQLTLENGLHFTGNGIGLDSADDGTAVPLVVFTPGTTTFRADSTWQTADPLAITATRPGASVTGTLTIRANDALVSKVQEEVDAYLDGCATQTVLLPSGCPFGQEISNRVVSTPAWSMSEYPPVMLEAAGRAGVWRMPSTPGAAHLTVFVQSLFDGSTFTFDEDVPFNVGNLVRISADDSVSITPAD